jgi:hypothetical protein
MSDSLFPLSYARSVLVVLGAMLLALALVVAASALDPKKADADRVVTKTFNKPAAILIPDGAIPGSEDDCHTGPTEGMAGRYPSNRSISAFPADSDIVDVNLVLKSLQHTWIVDVDVLLSKGLRKRTSMSDVGAAPNSTASPSLSTTRPPPLCLTKRPSPLADSSQPTSPATNSQATKIASLGWLASTLALSFRALTGSSPTASGSCASPTTVPRTVDSSQVDGA